MNKNGKMIMIVLGIILVIIGGVVIISNLNKEELPDGYPIELGKTDKKIVAMNKYENYAWGYVCNATVIFNDGTIYTYESDSRDNGYAETTLEDFTVLVCENGNKQKEQLKQSELDEILSNAKKLKDTIEYENVACDAGTGKYCVVKTETGEVITLVATGDSEGENKTKEAKNIMKILKKYI